MTVVHKQKSQTNVNSFIDALLTAPIFFLYAITLNPLKRECT